MIVVNLWFINHSNGLFHYGLDYADALRSDVREVWIRNPSLAPAIRRRLPWAQIRILTFGALLLNVALLFGRGDLLFTPSSHPIALRLRQVVVVHDTFPFNGPRGAIKLALFRLALVISGATAAYINCTDSYVLLRRCGLSEPRMRYLPNRIPAPVADRLTTPLVVESELIIGLFGSDSPKKNYDELFACFGRGTTPVAVTWRIYGHANSYTNRLIAEYPELRIEVINSDVQTIDEFIDRTHLAVSVARGEGFARPVAMALMRGVPSWLLDTPVFREFYEDSARLFATVDAMVRAISALRPGDELGRPHLESEKDLRADFERAIAWLGSI